MLTFTGKGSTQTCDGVTRRDFLQAGALGAVGLSLPQLDGPAGRWARWPKGTTSSSCIMIFNLGAPSQIDLFDPKPDAPAEIRGPFKPISTKSTDIQLTELLPLHAKIADKFSLVRSCYHTAAAVHDTGHQMMQTGRLFTGGVNTPHVGCALQLPPRLAQRAARPRHPARGDGPDRRQHAPRPGRRLPRQGVRPVRAQLPTRPSRTSRSPTCCRPKEIGEARARAPPQAARRRRRHGARSSRPARAPSSWTPTSQSAFKLMTSTHGPRRVRPDEGARRPSASATA